METIMEMDLLALVLFIVTIVLAFIRKVNIGILAIAVGAIAVRIFGLTDKQLISGISSSMFCTLVGITFLFAVVKSTGALDLLAEKIISATGKKVWLLPIAIYIAGFIVAGVGPGAIPALAIIPAIAVTTALKVGYNPIMLALIGEFGLIAGRMTSVTPEAVVITSAAATSGVDNVMPAILACQTVITLVISILVFIYFKGYKLTTANATVTKPGPFAAKQLIALSGILLMLVAFISSAVLVLFGIAPDGECLKALPWGTIIMVLGVGVLLTIVDKVGGIKLLSAAISSIMTSNTAIPLMGVSAGLLSLVSSALAVVYPTMMPMCTDIAAQVGGVEPLALMAAVGAGGSLAGISPMSTGGALILAAMGTNVENFTSTQQAKVFVQLLMAAAASLVVIIVVSALLFDPIVSLFI